MFHSGKIGKMHQGDAMQRPFGTSSCVSSSPPHLPSGAPRGGESSWSGALKPGDGEACWVRGWVSHALAPPSIDQTIPGRRTERRIKQRQKLPCRAWDADPKHKPLPLPAPASPRREGSGARLAPGKINTVHPCRLGLGARTLAGPSLGGPGAGVAVDLLVNWDSVRTDGSKEEDLLTNTSYISTALFL